MEPSLREALELGHNYLGTEHILLGLVREGEGAGAQVLVSLGAELARVGSGFPEKVGFRMKALELRTEAGAQDAAPGPIPICDDQSWGQGGCLLEAVVLLPTGWRAELDPGSFTLLSRTG